MNASDLEVLTAISAAGDTAAACIIQYITNP